MQLTQLELDSLLDMKMDHLFAKWIHRLRLLDWDVKWRIVRKDELGDDHSGRCDSVLMKKMASIRILHPDDASTEWVEQYDLELTIVHELLHLHLDGWAQLIGEGDQGVVLLEQTVHALSSVLLAADRRNPRWENFPEFCSVQDPRYMVR